MVKSRHIKIVLDVIMSLMLLILMAFQVTGYSGIVMSRYVFDFLPMKSLDK